LRKHMAAEDNLVMKLSYQAPRLKRILLFLVCGSTAAALNLVLAFIGVDLLGFSSDLQQNYVNIVTMEAGLVYSFFVYKAFVWKDKISSTSRILLRQLPIYHLSAGAAFVARGLLIFPLLQLLGVHYLLNIIVGLLSGAAITFVLSDRYVFTASFRESNS
jgi:dolichol-phosphate mannosyltransferase